MKKALVIDGNSLVYRVFWATFKMLDYYKKNNLTPTNATNLFIKAVIKLLYENNYDYAFVAFDHAKHTFRSEMLEAYKANRKPMPDDLRIQLPIIHSFLDTLGIYHQSKEGFEADDLIGSYCKLMNSNDVEVEVFTSDKDMLQLVNDKTHVNLFKTGISETIKYDLNNFGNLYHNLNPSQVIDFKAIVGDGSDNFCGIKGIGPKTAANLLLKYGSFRNIYDNLSQLPEAQAQKFIENKNSGELCYEIATIKCDLFNNTHIQEFVKRSQNPIEFVRLCSNYKLPSLIDYFNNHKH